jgi:hypothetical protein
VSFGNLRLAIPVENRKVSVVSIQRTSKAEQIMPQVPDVLEGNGYILFGPPRLPPDQTQPESDWSASGACRPWRGKEVARLKHERRALPEHACAAKRPLTWHEEEQLLAWYCDKVEGLLDAGRGACWLSKGQLATLVANLAP